MDGVEIKGITSIKYEHNAGNVANLVLELNPATSNIVSYKSLKVTAIENDD